MDTNCKEKVLNKLFGEQIDDLKIISGEDIQTAVKKLKAGKSPGIDGLYSEH